MNKKKMSKKRLGVWKAWLVALSFCCGVGGVEVPPALGTETTTSVPEVVHSLFDKAHAFEKMGNMRQRFLCMMICFTALVGHKIRQFNDLWRRL